MLSIFFWIVNGRGEVWQGWKSDQDREEWERIGIGKDGKSDDWGNDRKNGYFWGEVKVGWWWKGEVNSGKIAGGVGNFPLPGCEKKICSEKFKIPPVFIPKIVVFSSFGGLRGLKYFFEKSFLFLENKG